MKTAIVGSRDFLDYNYMVDKISSIPITEIISGGAKGADSLGAKYADDNKIKLTVFPAEWDKFGRAAGMIRNKLIVDDADLIIAFWDGKSKGTKNSIDRAIKDNKKTVIINYITQELEIFNESNI